MATLNLGRIKPVFRGAYAGGTAYVIDDIVTSGNETFICIQASTGNATSNASYWTKLAAKGTDGTDVGTTITTQGDILYRDGSGLQRLAKGTAGQQLAMNTGATAPEWVNASSDFVKLGSVTANQISVATFDNLFTSDYKAYKIFMKRVHGSTDNSSVRVRYRGGGSQLSDSVYKNFHTGGYFASNNNVSLTNRSWNDNYHNLTLNGLDNSARHGMTGEYTLFEPQSTDVATHHRCEMTHNVYDQTLVWTYASSGFYDNTTAITGIEFYMNTGSISGIFTLYGLKE